MKKFLYPLLLPLLLVLGACSKSPVVETESEGEKQQGVKKEVQPEEPVAHAKLVKESDVNKLMRRINGEPSEEVLIDSDLWYVVEGGTVKIIENRSGGLLGNPGTRLPEKIDGKPVTSIGPKAYAGTRQRVFIIPDTVTDIGEEAFADCYSTLEEVKIGKNVTSIGKGAFRFSMPLKSITIPGSVISIGEEAFMSCRTLTNITLQEGVSSIGKEAFANTYVQDITIPESLKNMGKGAFYLCSRLSSVTFLGDAPEEVGRVFPAKVIIYRKPEAKGWGDTWGGRPVKLISEKP
ncbi:MAG: leucine-rich repeat domain-containing protein [Verrucomicrobiaceae bacterium]|nr:leucine-rich repeat domain-containing protein [Verrucomicrobiaceae bacterium]